MWMLYLPQIKFVEILIEISDRKIRQYEIKSFGTTNNYEYFYQKCISFDIIDANINLLSWDGTITAKTL